MNEPSRVRFDQSGLHGRVRCELVEDGLVYEQRSMLSRVATRVPFESMPDDPIRESRISRSWAFAVTASFAALLYSLQPFVVAAPEVPPAPIVVAVLALGVSVLGLRAHSGHFVVFPCEGKRVEFRDAGSEPSLAAFLDQLQLRKSKYLSETYGPRPAEPESERTEFVGFDETEDDSGGYRH